MFSVRLRMHTVVVVGNGTVVLHRCAAIMVWPSG